MAIIDNFLPTRPIEFVAIYTQDFRQIFTEAKSIKAVVKPQSKSMEHPLESGAYITDHVVFLPTEIEISLLLQAPDYQDVYKTIQQYWRNATLLVVQTRAGIFENQFITAMPHEEDPDQYDMLAVALTFRQVQFAQPQYGIRPRNLKNSTTVSRGTQQGTPAPVPQTTAAKAIYNRVFGGTS